MSANESKNVALLAREGQARETLRLTLREAGAAIVLEADPVGIDPATLKAAQAQVVLVALEPALEDSLAELGEVLDDPAVNVIFEDAELVAKRSGWDAQRWARHLSAKLYGHGDVLPPGREADEFVPAIAPSSQLAALAPGDAAPADEVALSLEPVGAELSPLDAGSLEPDRSESETLSLVEESSLSLVEEAEPEVSEGESLSLAGEAGLSLVDDVPVEPVPSLDKAADDASPLFQADEPEAWQPPSRPLEDGLIEGFDISRFAAPPPVAVPPPLPPAPTPEPAPAPAPKVPLILELEAIDETPASAAGPDRSEQQYVSGAVLLFAGIGGPDAVRQVLTALPEDFQRPVLLLLRLDGGRYDNLVRQLERVSSLPVELARAGETAQATRVYVVPGDVAATAGGDRIHFNEGGTDAEALLAELSPQSAVLLLSGSDPALVEMATGLAAKGAYVAGQALQGCYDPAASKALQQRGGVVGTPAELVAALVQQA